MRVLRNERVTVIARTEMDGAAPIRRADVVRRLLEPTDKVLVDLVLRIGPYEDGNPPIWGWVSTEQLDIRWGNVPEPINAPEQDGTPDVDPPPWGWSPDGREAVVFASASPEAAYRRAEARAGAWFAGLDHPSCCLERIDRVELWLRRQDAVWTVERYTLALDGHRVDWTGPPHTPLPCVHVVGPSMPDNGPERPGVALPIPPAPRPPLDLRGPRSRPGRATRGRWAATDVSSA